MRLRLAGLVIAVLVLVPVLQYICLTSSSSFVATLLMMVSMLMLPPLLLGALALVPIFLIAMCFKSERAFSTRGLALAIAVIIGTFCSGKATGLVRHYCFEQMTVRARPLVAAIDAYQKQHASPPCSLDVLVPKYLPKIPDTGMGAYPSFNYTTKDETDPWRLEVPCSLGLLNWDVCFYRPSKKYSAYEYGGGVEPIGDWRYVHE